MKRIWLIALIGIIANALVSCGGEKEEVKTYFTVTFDAGGERPFPKRNAWKREKRPQRRQPLPPNRDISSYAGRPTAQKPTTS